VVLNGKPVGNYSASAYYREQLNTMLLEEALKAYNRLSAQYHPIVIEGAGSISELNLKQRDIANMRIAMATHAATILVADIDRGGVFGSVYGSIALLDEDERRRIKGIIINKFRGDLSLFDEGRKLLEELTGVPVLGVVPYFTNIHIEEEDSVALSQKSAYYEQGKVNVVVVLLGRMANYTDFDALEHDSRVHLYYSNNTAEIAKADIIILPGSKNTLHDLLEIQRNGVAEAIVRAAKAGKHVVGICGGYQMMGQWIEDPEGTEGDIPRLPGLGLLPVTTVITSLKETRQCTFLFKEKDTLCTGYEIHMGRTEQMEKAVSLNKVDENTQEGCRVSDRVWGTYMHGILDNSVVREDLLGSFQQRLEETMDYAVFKDRQYDLLADHLRDYIDIGRIYEIMKEEA
jgi:adenosylcobyric acid synthase